MKRVFLIAISFLFLSCANLCFAQEKQIVDNLSSWRNDKTCDGMELNTLIRIYGDEAVFTLERCCKKHSSACLDAYSGPDNKTLMYTAVEVKAYDVMRFLFRLSPNYTFNVDNYGITKETRKENEYVIFIHAVGNEYSMTPLMLACYNGDLTATTILIEHSASLLKQNLKGKSAYQYAKEAKNPDKGFMNYVEQEYTKQKNKFGYIPQQKGTNKTKTLDPRFEFEIYKRNIIDKKLLGVNIEEDVMENRL